MKVLYKGGWLIILLFFINVRLYSQSVGEYKTNATGTWSWTTTANWLIFNGTSWDPATVYPGQDASAGVVTIDDNTLVTIDQNISFPISGLIISAYNNNSSLTFTGADSLTITGAVSFSIPNSSSVSNTLSISSGILNCSSLSMVSTYDNSKLQNVTISNGELNVAGSLTMSSATQNTLIITGAGKLRIGDSFSPVSTVTLNPSSIIEFNGITSQLIPALSSGYSNLIISGNGSKTIQANSTVNGNLTINTGVEFSDGGYIVTGSGLGNFILSSGATYTTTQAGATIFPQNFAASTVDPTSLINLNGSGIYSLPSSPSSFGSININAASTITLTAPITINGDFKIGSGARLNDGGNVITGNSSGLFTISSGAVFASTQTSSTVFPLNFTTSFDPSSTILLNGSGNYTLPVTPNSFGIISISGTSTVTLGSPISVTGDFSVNSGVTLNDGGFTITGNLGVFKLCANATFSTNQVSLFFPQNVTNNFDPTSTLSFNGSGNYTLPAIMPTIGSLLFNGTGTVSLASAITVNGNITINSGGLNDNGFQITGVGGNLLNVASNASYITKRIATPWFPTNVNISLAPNSTVDFAGNGSYTLPNTPSTFENLIFDGTGTHTFSNSKTINKNFTINFGTVADGGFQIIGNNTGTLTLASATNLTLGTAAVSPATVFPTNFSTTTLASNSTIIYNSNASQVISKVPVYGNLTLAASAAVTKTLSGNLNIAGTLTINANNTLADGGNIIACAGALTINGTHTGSGKIQLNGSGTQNISGIGSINNCEINKSAGNANLTSNFMINGVITITLGNFSLNTWTLSTLDNIIINGGKFLLTVSATAQSLLKVSNGRTITNNGGTISFTGSSSKLTKLSLNGSNGYYSYIQNSGIFSAQYYYFENCLFTISGGTVSGNTLNYGTFSTIGTPSYPINSAYLNLGSFGTALTANVVTFNAGTQYNVSKSSGSIITLNSGNGTLYGSAYEKDDLSATTGFVQWSAGSIYYSHGTVDFTTTTNWKDGSGVALPSTAYFADKMHSFVINANDLATVNATIDVFDLTVNANATLTIGNNGTTKTITIEDSLSVSGLVNVGGTVANTLTLYGDLNINNNGVLNLYNNSTVNVNTNFQGGSIQSVKGSGSASNITFNNITLLGLTNLTPCFALNIKGNVTFNNNTTFTSGSYTHTVAGNWIGVATGIHNSSGTIQFNGSAPVISGQTNFNNVNFSGVGTPIIGGLTSSTITIDGSLTVSNNTNLIIGNTTNINRTISVNGDITINPLGTISVGAFNATHQIILNGNLIVDGTLNMFNATGQVCDLTFTGATSQSISGAGPICNFNKITVNKGIDSTSILEVTRVITQKAPVSSANNLILTSGTFKLSSASTLIPYFGSQILCAAPSRLWINNAAADISSVGAGSSISAQVATINGTLLVSHGKFEYGSGNDRMVLTAATSALIITGSDAIVTIYGGLNNNTALPAALTITNGKLIFDCQPLIGNNYSANAYLVDLRGLITFTGGTMLFVNPSKNLTPNSTASAILGLTSLNPSSTFIGSTIQFGDGISSATGGSSDGFNIRSNNAYYLGNIIVNGNAPSLSYRYVKLFSNVYVAGTITINSSSELQLNGLTLFSKGNFVSNGTFNTSTLNSTLTENGNSTQTISGTPITLLNFKIDNIAGVDIQCPIMIQTSLSLVNGSLNSSIGSITLGNSTGTLTITRTDGNLSAIPIWNIAGVTLKLVYNSANAVTTGNELPKTQNGLISTLTNSSTSTVSLANTTNITLTTLILTSGILNLQNDTITIKGTITRTNGTLSSGVGASITFSNTANWTIPVNTFTNNSIELLNLTVNEGTSIIVASVVLPANLKLIIDGTLSLKTGRLALGANDSLVFQTGNTPIDRDGNLTIGTITTTPTASIIFGLTDASGNQIVIPNSVFTTAPSISGLIINRTNGVILGNQAIVITLAGTLNLKSGTFDLNGSSLITTAAIPFKRTNGILIATNALISFGTNAANALLPNDLFSASPALIKNLTINRSGGITLANQEIKVTGTTTFTNGIVAVKDYDFEIVTTAGTPSATAMVVQSGTGRMKHYYGATNFTFPLGDLSPAAYCPVNLNFSANATPGYISVTTSNGTNGHISGTTTDFLNRYWTILAPSLTTYKYTATFGYAVGDINSPNSQEVNFMEQIWNGSAWMQINTSTTNTATHVCSSGPTALTETTGPLNGNSFTTFPTTSGLYYWSKASTGWSTLTTWETSISNSDPGVNSGTPAAFAPTSANSLGIIIRSGNNVSLSGGYTLDQFVIKNGGTLIMNGTSFNLSNGTGDDLTVENGATIIATTGVIIATSPNVKITIDGTFKTSNSNGFAGTTTSTIRSTNNPTVSLINEPSSIIEYNGAAQIVTALTPYYNLKISATGINTINTLSNTVNINGDLTISAGTLDLASSSTINITGATTISSSGLLFFNGTTVKTVTIGGTLSGAGTIDMTGAAHTLRLAGATNGITTLKTDAYPSTIDYNGVGIQQVFSSLNYKSLTISGSGIKTAQGNVTVNNNLNISAGTLNLGTSMLFSVAGTATISGLLVFNGSTIKTVTIGGSLSGVGTIDMTGATHSLSLAGATNDIATLTTDANSSTIDYIKAGDQTTLILSPNYRNLRILNSGNKILTGAIMVNENLSVLGGTLIANSNVITGVSGKTFSIGNGAAYTSTHTVSSWFPTNMTCNFAPASTVNINGNGTFTLPIVPNSYGNLFFGAAGTKTMSTATTINGNLTIAAGSLSDGGYQIIGNSSGTLSVVAGSSLLIGSAAFPTIFSNILLAPNSTISYESAGIQTISNIPTYQNLILATNGSKNIVGATTIQGNLAINNSATLYFGTTAHTVTLTGDLSGIGNINMAGAAHSLILNGANNVISALTTDGNSSTITYSGTLAQTIFGSSNYRNLVLSGSGIKTISSASTINNNFTIGNGTTFVDGGFSCSLKGGLTNSGTFQGTGVTSVNGSGAQTLTCGNATFGTLEINNGLGSLSISGNNITIGDFTITSGTLTQNAITALSVTGNTYIYGPNGVLSFLDISGTKTFNNIKVFSGGKWFATTPIDFRLNGNLVVDPGGTFIASTGEYTLGGSANQTIDNNLSGFKLALNKSVGIVNSTLSTLTLTSLNLKPGNAGTFQAPPSLSILGDLTVNSGLFDASAANNLTVNGNITVNGGTVNWEPNVTLNGSNSQTITGIAIPSFTNLTINNSASGDAIVLNNSISVSNILTLSDGIVKTTATNLLQMGSMGTIAGIPSDNCFINGPMRHTINSIGGNVTKAFPVGKNGKMHMSEITINQATATNTTYTCEYINSSAVSLHALPTTTGLTNVSSLGYWHVDKTHEIIDYTTGNDANLTNASIKLYYLSNEGVTDPTHLFVAKSQNVSGTTVWKNVGGSANASSVTSGLFNAFCNISLASDCSCNALPISLTKFNVQKKNDDVAISWETASETNNDYFTLERSTDGKIWESIFTCKGAENSTEINIYSFIDKDVETGILYYRLKQTDFNGDYIYSDVRSIRISNSDLEFTVYPNPTNYYNVNIVVSGKKDEKIILEVSDNIGKVIYNGEVSLNNSTTKNINLADYCILHPGIFYTITVISNGKTISKKVSVQ